MLIYKMNLHQKIGRRSKLDAEKSHFPLNLTDRQTYGRIYISVYRVVSLLKLENNLSLKLKHTKYQADSNYALLLYSKALL